MKKSNAYFSRVYCGEILLKVCILHKYRRLPYYIIFWSKIRGKFIIFRNLPDKHFTFFKLNYCPNRYQKAAEFENNSPRVTLENNSPRITLEMGANRWKTAKEWLSLWFVVVIATVCDKLIKNEKHIYLCVANLHGQCQVHVLQPKVQSNSTFFSTL